VNGYQGEQLVNALSAEATISWVSQQEPLGTGHASLQALPLLQEVDRVLIAYGDIPLISVHTLQRLLKATPSQSIGFVTVEVQDPTGLGRVVRNEAGAVIRIVEEKDATAEEKKITEINTGFFLVPKNYLQQWLPTLSARNAQQEYYLSDIIAIASQQRISITTVSPDHEWETLGVNDKVQLAQLERFFQREQARQLLQKGVTLRDPARLDVRGTVSVGRDVTIDINVILEGKVIVGNQVTIGPNVYIKDAVLADGVEVLANSVIEGATLAERSKVGPFARIRPGTCLAAAARIGNFVEIKNTTVGKGTKINHLSYIGDASIGEAVNIGAGTITCNFDGKKKHKTIIANRVMVGSDTQFIAPVTVGEDVTIGAGTTVVRDIPPGYLVHNRVEHREIANWTRIDEEVE